jgi:hypothetical protein
MRSGARLHEAGKVSKSNTLWRDISGNVATWQINGAS